MKIYKAKLIEHKKLGNPLIIWREISIYLCQLFLCQTEKPSQDNDDFCKSILSELLTLQKKLPKICNKNYSHQISKITIPESTLLDHCI